MLPHASLLSCVVNIGYTPPRRETEKKWIDEQARLLEFERTQGAGLSDQSAREISEALKAEAEADRWVDSVVPADPACRLSAACSQGNCRLQLKHMLKGACH